MVLIQDYPIDIVFLQCNYTVDLRTLGGRGDDTEHKTYVAHVADPPPCTYSNNHLTTLQGHRALCDWSFSPRL